MFLSNRLANFRDKGSGLYEFTHSCERSTSRKRRGYFYPKGNGYNFFCHNCQESSKFFKFLERMDPLLYKEYRLESFSDSKQTQDKPEIKKVKEEKKLIPDGLICYTDLSDDHPAWKYIKKRKIPENRYKDLYFCKDFFGWGAKINNELSKVDTKEPRMVLKYKNKNGEEVGYTGRAFNASKLKYIELKLSDEELIYGLEYIDT